MPAVTDVKFNLNVGAPVADEGALRDALVAVSDDLTDQPCEAITPGEAGKTCLEVQAGVVAWMYPISGMSDDEAAAYESGEMLCFRCRVLTAFSLLAEAAQRATAESRGPDPGVVSQVALLARLRRGRG
jgi:hypothetical protein